MDVTWRNYVHEIFADKKSIVDIRRRSLTLDLSMALKIVPTSKIKEISPRIAAYYAHTSNMTLTRDINELIRLGLIEKTAEGVRAKKEVILAFLPHKKPAS